MLKIDLLILGQQNSGCYTCEAVTPSVATKKKNINIYVLNIMSEQEKKKSDLYRGIRKKCSQIGQRPREPRPLASQTSSAVASSARRCHTPGSEIEAPTCNRLHLHPTAPPLEPRTQTAPATVGANSMARRRQMTFRSTEPKTWERSAGLSCRLPLIWGLRCLLPDFNEKKFT